MCGISWHVYGKSLYFFWSFMVNLQYIIVNPSNTWHTSWWFFPTREWKNRTKLEYVKKRSPGKKKQKDIQKKQSPIDQFHSSRARDGQHPFPTCGNGCFKMWAWCPGRMEMEAFQLESYQTPAKWTEKSVLCVFYFTIRLGCEIADLDLAGETLGEFLLLTNQSIFISEKKKGLGGGGGWFPISTHLRRKIKNFQLRIFPKVSWNQPTIYTPESLTWKLRINRWKWRLPLLNLQVREVAANPKKGKGGMTPNLTSNDW